MERVTVIKRRCLMLRLGLYMRVGGDEVVQHGGQLQGSRCPAVLVLAPLEPLGGFYMIEHKPLTPALPFDVFARPARRG
jgi:hypothetical protein